GESTSTCGHMCCFFFFSSRRRHTRWPRDWSSDVCSSDLRHRGGLGQRVRVRKLRDDGRAALVDLHPHGMLTAPSGLFGGAAGSRARAYVTDCDTVLEGGAMVSLAELRRPGQRATIEIAGGSGYGPPIGR